MPLSNLSTDEKLDLLLTAVGKDAATKELEQKVTNAQHTAEQAMNAITSHEKVCELRYKNIELSQTALLSGVATMQASITALTKSSNIMNGIWVGTVGVGTIVGIITAVMKLAGGHAG